MVQRRPTVGGTDQVGQAADDRHRQQQARWNLPGGRAPDDQVKSAQKASQGAGFAQAAVGGSPEEVSQPRHHAVHLVGVHGRGPGDGIHGAVHVFESRRGQGPGEGDHHEGPSNHGRIEQVHAQAAKDHLADTDGHEGSDHAHVPGGRTGQGHGQDDAGDQGGAIPNGRRAAAHANEEQFRQQAAAGANGQLEKGIPAKYEQGHGHHRCQGDQHIHHHSPGTRRRLDQMGRRRDLNYRRCRLGGPVRLHSVRFLHFRLLTSDPRPRDGPCRPGSTGPMGCGPGRCRHRTRTRSRP